MHPLLTITNLDDEREKGRQRPEYLFFSRPILALITPTPLRLPNTKKEDKENTKEKINKLNK